MKQHCVDCRREFETGVLSSEGVCQQCQDGRLFREKENQRLSLIYGIPDAGPPLRDGRILTLADAHKHLQAFLGQPISFNTREVLEAPTWWYLPFCWIGCRGFIIDKIDGYVNQLGSCHVLDDCFWAHDHGIKYPYCDLTILRVHNLSASVEVLLKMGNRSPINPIPNKEDVHDRRTSWWRSEELAGMLATLPVTFSNQHLWLTIRKLRQAAEQGYFEFSVTHGSLSQERI